MKTKTSNIAVAGLTLVEMTVIVVITGFLGAVAIPNFVRARTATDLNACVSNLRQIDVAKRQWALENNQVTTATPTQASLTPYLSRSGLTGWPACPANGSYTINSVAKAPTCNISNHGLP